MYGHPAIAYLVAQNILNHRSVRLGRYRLTLSKETPGVPRTV